MGGGDEYCSIVKRTLSGCLMNGHLARASHSKHPACHPGSFHGRNSFKLLPVNVLQATLHASGMFRRTMNKRQLFNSAERKCSIVLSGLLKWARTLAIVASILGATLVFSLGVFRSSRTDRLPLSSFNGSIEAGILLSVISMAVEGRQLTRTKRSVRSE